MIRDYLSFNRTELRGVFVLFSILVGLILAHAFIPSEICRQPIDFTSFEKETKAFECAWQKAREEESQMKKNKYLSKMQVPAFYQQDSLKHRKTESLITFTVEINAADSFDLQRLRGIGPGFARRIIAYRQRLGGFLYKKQLLEVWGMDTIRYALIEKNIIVAMDSVKKVDLNQIAFKELLRHPYFSFELTKSIMQYRQKVRQFKTVEELRNIQGVNDSVFGRIFPYVRVGP